MWESTECIESLGTPDAQASPTLLHKPQVVLSRNIRGRAGKRPKRAPDNGTENKTLLTSQKLLL